MKKTNLKEKLQNWKLGNYFRELSIVTAGVFITLAGTDFINSASQEKQINKSMQMIKMELEENLKSINQAEAAYLNEINFFRLLIQKQDSLQTIKASILENNANAPFAYENCEYSVATQSRINITPMELSSTISSADLFFLFLPTIVFYPFPRTGCFRRRLAFC